MTLETSVQGLQNEVRKKLASLRDGYFKEDAVSPVEYQLNHTRELQGHFQKVYSIDWGGYGSDNLLSGSQDGKLIVWNAETTNKTNAIPLANCWVMSCAFEKSQNKLVASGGLDSIVSIYKLENYQIGQQVDPSLTLRDHDGYVSCCVFLNENSLVSSSGDSSCKVWDINTGTCLSDFKDHTSDVMSVDVSPDNPNIFISGSVDNSCRLWDVRIEKNSVSIKSGRTSNIFQYDDQQTKDLISLISYENHNNDVNSVRFFPSGHAFASGSDDASCRLWDLRCHQQVNFYQSQSSLCGVTSLDFSSSGRLLYSGYDDCNVFCWDTLHTQGMDQDNIIPVQTINRHEAKVVSLKVHSEGKALATCSWDTLIKIFA